jgi:glutathione S-transferase
MPANGEPVRLYESRDCWKCVEVREVLERLGVPYEQVQVRGNPEARATMVRAMGEPPRVPMLTDGGLAVWDRRRIIAYLEQTYGGTNGLPWRDLPVFMGGSCTLDGDCG